jgi:hypothetical protein
MNHNRVATIPGPSSLIYHASLVDTLDHFEVPFFGRLANSFVDNE